MGGGISLCGRKHPPVERKSNFESKHEDLSQHEEGPGSNTRTSNNSARVGSDLRIQNVPLQTPIKPPAMLARTPVGPEKQVYRHYCPFCFNFYSQVLVFECCSHNICKDCAEDILVQQNCESKLAVGVTLDMKCSHCMAHPTKLRKTNNTENTRNYMNSPAVTQQLNECDEKDESDSEDEKSNNKKIEEKKRMSLKTGKLPPLPPSLSVRQSGSSRQLPFPETNNGNPSANMQRSSSQRSLDSIGSRRRSSHNIVRRPSNNSNLGDDELQSLHRDLSARSTGSQLSALQDINSNLSTSSDKSSNQHLPPLNHVPSQQNVSIASSNSRESLKSANSERQIVTLPPLEHNQKKLKQEEKEEEEEMPDLKDPEVQEMPDLKDPEVQKATSSIQNAFRRRRARKSVEQPQEVVTEEKCEPSKPQEEAEEEEEMPDLKDPEVQKATSSIQNAFRRRKARKSVEQPQEVVTEEKCEPSKPQEEAEEEEEMPDLKDPEVQKATSSMNLQNNKKKKKCLT
eukprot:TRINITY_DN188_c0_g1_i9.p1 TRINITY_DN188_c0_g1~~TRINITY_DN188_c0_g1_i9.p1  ORF type:complete len:512 (-),score=161.60 TRINITY_DN188_c0_g1_i9:820-2355(-)